MSTTILEEPIIETTTKQRRHYSSKKYKWQIIKFDEVSKNFEHKKFRTIKELNEKMNLNLSADLAWRLSSGKKYDKEGTKGDWSLKAKYGNIDLKKINETIN